MSSTVIGAKLTETGALPPQISECAAVKMQAVIPPPIQAAREIVLTPQKQSTEFGTYLLCSEKLNGYTSVYSYSLFLSTLPSLSDSR